MMQYLVLTLSLLLCLSAAGVRGQGWQQPGTNPQSPWPRQGWQQPGTNPQSPWPRQGWNRQNQNIPGGGVPGVGQGGVVPGSPQGGVPWGRPASGPQTPQPGSGCCDGRTLYGGHTGTTPLPMPKHCMDIREMGGARDGVYTIFVSELNTCGKKEVYCDQTTDGGGWTVIQRRVDGRLDFLRDWNEYKMGFGFLQGEFWLGNDWINKLAMQGPHELRVDLADFQMQTKFARYRVFSLADEYSNYTLKVERYDPLSTAGDAMTGHNNVPFSTYDRDNDRWSGNCARQYTGAWWYTSCHNSNLNGRYLKGPTRQYARGVVWNQWRGYSYSLRYTEMKIRPLL